MPHWTRRIRRGPTTWQRSKVAAAEVGAVRSPTNVTHGSSRRPRRTGRAGLRGDICSDGALNGRFQRRPDQRSADADATLRTLEAEADDLKASIYYDVRTAFLDLQATREQLEVASRSRDLAAQTLVQARDRFAAGVASNIEVVQAQEAVAESSEQYIGALYGFNVSKALLARGLGVAEAATRQYLGGVR